jgi:hypothetical protein
LKEHHGFVHVDVDRIGGLPRDLLNFGPRVALDWGFPARFLETVVDLRDKGVQLWWFDGDRAAAEMSYFARPSSPSRELFERQMNGIKARWKEIEAVFSGRTIQTVFEDGRYLTAEQIFDIMFP